MTETKNIYPTTQGKIIQLDYDFITSLSGQCSYCLTDAQVQMILAITDYYGWATRWFSESGTIDQQMINDLQAGLVEALMCGCCPDTSILSRLTENGHYQTSTDGGATWTDAPQEDPRNGVPQSPPRLPLDTINDECTYADSVVKLFKQGVIDILVEGNTVQQIIAIITGILAGVLGFAGGILTFVGAAIAVLANAIFAIGITAVQAAFTSDFWDMLRCLISENINSDGSFTQTQVDAIYAGMTGNSLAIFIVQNWIAFLGTQGLTNSARALNGAADAICCPTLPVYKFSDCDPTTVHLLTPDEDGVYTLVGDCFHDGGGFTGYLADICFSTDVTFPADATCSLIADAAGSTGSPSFAFRIACGTGTIAFDFGIAILYQYRSSVPFEYKFTLA